MRPPAARTLLYMYVSEARPRALEMPCPGPWTALAVEEELRKALGSHRVTGQPAQCALTFYSGAPVAANRIADGDAMCCGRVYPVRRGPPDPCRARPPPPSATAPVARDRRQPWTRYGGGPYGGAPLSEYQRRVGR